ncbi:phosphatase PAP2 family protein [Paucibacter sp. Y2R2-4]|uniref:phosphatase PAP2 family protein n=1 Tax=Paucibacter sp. Y2R2-4 TaxID=2893553 RepID=UPI0021E44C89|nr:phosphatase PAP2 family protein [Paucibacter sp. Y2R2-4]MCV2350501.1 phosphatase PAP2 family protein [Paucibacter sp. Y2R2-4]
MDAMNFGSVSHSSSVFWQVLTRLGELQLLLPLALLAMALLWHQRVSSQADPQTATAKRWLLGLSLAIALTAASKLAFFGWGIGIAAWDFTGISGHAMASASILPGLAWVVMKGRRLRVQQLWVGLAVLLAALVAYSRLKVGAHSPSESLAGFVLGSAVSAFSLRGVLLRPGPGLALPLYLPAALMAALLLLPFGAPKSRTHDAVIHLALKISGRSTAFTRDDLRRRLPTLPAQPSAPLNAAPSSHSKPVPKAAAGWGLAPR